ncbi:MAG: hypothetical protein NWR45_02755 [Candidatus Nanopelagicales bacterium]|nr:hypothetical protein [Candidatus Nanopelagicales bacterium]
MGVPVSRTRGSCWIRGQTPVAAAGSVDYVAGFVTLKILDSEIRR